jgi:DNA-binding transcriptional LysR family regulator
MAGLKQLQYFVTAARSGSLVAASRILHVSQPALSLQIKHLDARHGVRLLERHSRGVALTAATHPGDRAASSPGKCRRQCRTRGRRKP